MAAYAHFLFAGVLLKGPDGERFERATATLVEPLARCRPVPRSRLHMTGRPIAETGCSPSLSPWIERAAVRLGNLRAGAFHARFECAGSLGSAGAGKPTPFALKGGGGLAGARGLFRSLNGVLSGAVQEGLEDWKGGGPHMTLCYRADFARPIRLAEPLTWVVDEVCLIHSFRGEGRYEVVGRWPLSPLLL